MEEYAMLPNIRRHSIVVAQVGLQLVSGLRENQVPGDSIPDESLIIAGALLHDIAKTPCLKDGCDHAKVGAEICHSLGYPEIACIVGEHVLLQGHDPHRYSRGVFSATEIIYYADKRVRHEEIVTLEDRLEYILENYGMEDQVLHRRIRENFYKCLELEEQMFQFLPFSSDQMAERVLDNPLDPLFTFVSDPDRIR